YSFFLYTSRPLRHLHSFPTRRSSDLVLNLRTAPTHSEENWTCWSYGCYQALKERDDFARVLDRNTRYQFLVREVAYDLLGLPRRSEEHTSELQSRFDLVCRLLLEKKN